MAEKIVEKWMSYEDALKRAERAEKKKAEKKTVKKSAPKKKTTKK